MQYSNTNWIFCPAIQKSDSGELQMPVNKKGCPKPGSLYIEHHPKINSNPGFASLPLGAEETNGRYRYSELV